MAGTSKLLGTAEIVDGNGKPVNDQVVQGIGRCLLVVECCALFLRQAGAVGPGCEQEMTHYTVNQGRMDS